MLLSSALRIGEEVGDSPGESDAAVRDAGFDGLRMSTCGGVLLHGKPNKTRSALALAWDVLRRQFDGFRVCLGWIITK